MRLTTAFNKRYFRVVVLCLLGMGILLVNVNSANAFPQEDMAAWGNHRPMPPLIHIVAVQPDEEITLETENFPANQDFVVTIGPFGSRGVRGIEVGEFNSGPEGFVQATFPIPVEFEGAHRLAVRAQGYGRFPVYSFNWFENMSISSEESPEIAPEDIGDPSVMIPLPVITTTTGLVDITYTDQSGEPARTYYQYDFLDSYTTFDAFANVWEKNELAQIVWLWVSETPILSETNQPTKEGADTEETTLADITGDFYYAFQEPDTESETNANDEAIQEQLLLTTPDAKVEVWRGYVPTMLVTLPELEQGDSSIPSLEWVMIEQNFPQVITTESITANSSVADTIFEIMDIRNISLGKLKQGIVLIQVKDLDSDTFQNTLVLISEDTDGPARGRNSTTWYACQAPQSRWGRFHCWVRGYGRR